MAQPLLFLVTITHYSSSETVLQKALQEFDVEVRYMKGSQNVVADYLSRV